MGTNIQKALYIDHSAPIISQNLVCVLLIFSLALFLSSRQKKPSLPLQYARPISKVFLPQLLNLFNFLISDLHHVPHLCNHTAWTQNNVWSCSCAKVSSSRTEGFPRDLAHAMWCEKYADKQMKESLTFEKFSLARKAGECQGHGEDVCIPDLQNRGRAKYYQHKENRTKRSVWRTLEVLPREGLWAF